MPLKLWIIFVFIVAGNNLKVSSHVFASPERDLSETTSFSTVFKDGVRVTVSNFGFLKINEKEINSNGEYVQLKQNLNMKQIT